MYMQLHVKVRKVGTSFVITLPEQIIKETKIKLGDELCLDINNDNSIQVRLCKK